MRRSRSARRPWRTAAPAAARRRPRAARPSQRAPTVLRTDEPETPGRGQQLGDDRGRTLRVAGVVAERAHGPRDRSRRPPPRLRRASARRPPPPRSRTVPQRRCTSSSCPAVSRVSAYYRSFVPATPPTAPPVSLRARLAGGETVSARGSTRPRRISSRPSARRVRLRDARPRARRVRHRGAARTAPRRRPPAATRSCAPHTSPPTRSPPPSTPAPTVCWHRASALPGGRDRGRRGPLPAAWRARRGADGRAPPGTARCRSPTIADRPRPTCVAGVQIEGPDGLAALDAILAHRTARARLHRSVRSVAAPRRAGRDRPPRGGRGDDRHRRAGHGGRRRHRHVGTDRCGGPSVDRGRRRAGDGGQRDRPVHRRGGRPARRAQADRTFAATGVNSGDASSPGKWQATNRPGSTSTSGGSTVEHGSGRAIGQRGWKRQPDGTAIGLGASPRQHDPPSSSPGPRDRAPGSRPAAPRCRDAAGRVYTLVGRAELDDPAEVHHRDAVRDVADDGEVVGDEHERQVEPVLQVDEQVDDLGLDRHVQRRHRLVGEDHARFDATAPGPARCAGAGRRRTRAGSDRRRRRSADEPEQLGHAAIDVVAALGASRRVGRTASARRSVGGR